jgi:putative hydrolase of the HAD superfamily
MTPRAIFFDFGGTLVAPLRDGYPVFAEVLGSRGVPLDRASYDRADSEVSRSRGPFLHQSLGKAPGFWDEYTARVLDRVGVTDRAAEMVHALHSAFTSPRWHRPYPEAEDVLREVQREGLMLHVVSNNTELLPETIRRLGWGAWFSTVTYSQETGAEKPDPRVFPLALDRAGCSPKEVLHVGDSWEADVLGARASGIPAIWVDRGELGSGRNCPRVKDLRGILSYLGTAPQLRSGRARED